MNKQIVQLIREFKKKSQFAMRKTIFVVRSVLLLLKNNLFSLFNSFLNYNLLLKKSVLIQMNFTNCNCITKIACFLDETKKCFALILNFLRSFFRKTIAVNFPTLAVFKFDENCLVPTQQKPYFLWSL